MSDEQRFRWLTLQDGRQIHVGILPDGREIPAVIERETIGRARTWDGRAVAVVATVHHIPWPGVNERVTYAVEIEGDAGRHIKPASFGFFTQREAFRFLEAEMMRRTTYDLDGREGHEYITGLSLPPGMIARPITQL